MHIQQTKKDSAHKTSFKSCPAPSPSPAPITGARWRPTRPIRRTTTTRTTSTRPSPSSASIARKKVTKSDISTRTSAVSLPLARRQSMVGTANSPTTSASGIARSHGKMRFRSPLPKKPAPTAGTLLAPRIRFLPPRKLKSRSSRSPRIRSPSTGIAMRKPDPPPGPPQPPLGLGLRVPPVRLSLPALPAKVPLRSTPILAKTTSTLSSFSTSPSTLDTVPGMSLTRDSSLPSGLLPTKSTWSSRSLQRLPTLSQTFSLPPMLPLLTLRFPRARLRVPGAMPGKL